MARFDCSNLLNSSWIPSSRNWVNFIAWTNIIFGIACVSLLIIETAEELTVITSLPDMSHIARFLLLKTLYLINNSIEAGMAILLLMGVRKKNLWILNSWLVVTSAIVLMELLIVTPVVTICLDKADLIGLLGWETPWWIANCFSLIVVNKYKKTTEKEIHNCIQTLLSSTV